MEDTLGVPPQVGDPLAEWAAYYATDRRWEVLAGVRLLEPGDGLPARCGCGEPQCLRPGDHPADPRGTATASSSPTTVRRQWRDAPEATVLLPTGRSFDVLDVSEEAGCLAMARLGRTQVRLGPVVCTPNPDRRMRFLVQAGGAGKLGDLLRAAGWPPARLDLRGLGEGEWIAAPPSRVGVHGSIRWVVEPNSENLLLPEVEQMLPALAYACGTAARLPRQRVGVGTPTPAAGTGSPAAAGSGRRMVRPARPVRPPAAG